MTVPAPARHLQLAIRASRPAIGRVGGGVHLLVRAEPPPRARSARRRPVALALVIDRSGSMGESVEGSSGAVPSRRTGRDSGAADKLSFVRAATLRLLDLVHDGDAVALIAFDDSVQVLKPLTIVDDRSRRALAAAVDRLEPGGSTFLEGAVRAGLEQLGREARDRYGCKLVLLSDGEANVGERRPAVLAEIAAEAARAGVTTATLGVGFAYNIGLMTALAEAGNGDFSHIRSLESLDEILREEFTAAAEVTARGVEVTVEVPERLAFGTNVNSYRQESTDGGFRVFLGDLVRPKEFLFEVTTPVALEGDELTVGVHAAYCDAADAPQESTSGLSIRVCEAAEALAEPVDEAVIDRLLLQLPAQAQMATILAYEAGDAGAAAAALQASRAAMAGVHRLYGTAATARPEMTAWESRLTDLAAGTASRTLSAPQMKGMFAASHDLSRSRPPRPGPPHW